MWLFALFDLPTETKEDKRNYVRFRNHLLKEGFEMFQYSVYARYYESMDSVNARKKRLKRSLPPAGEVRLLPVTDRQFGLMEVFRGRKRAPTEDPPDQMDLF
ncbi:MAG: CRISPR-associated endonuclease Cas2 [bacterium]|nr:CRISPR-associated endonuclease Cas2 [bacterium]